MRRPGPGTTSRLLYAGLTTAGLITVGGAPTGMIGLLDLSELLESGLQAVAAAVAIVLGLLVLIAAVFVDGLWIWGVGLLAVGVVLFVLSLLGVIDAALG